MRLRGAAPCTEKTWKRSSPRRHGDRLDHEGGWKQNPIADLTRGDPVTEYTIHIDSIAGVGTDEGLTAVHEHLTNAEQHYAVGASVSIDQHGAYSATFQVDADTIGSAALVGAGAFAAALANTGHIDATARLEVLANENPGPT